MKKNILRALVLSAGLLAAGSAYDLHAEPWKFPAQQGVRFNNLPDWGQEGFTLEVWCRVDALPSGYAVLMRDSFGYPKFSKADRDIDGYMITGKSKDNAVGRTYTALETGKYHYYVLTGDKEKSITYRDGKLMRTNKGFGIPKYNVKNTMHIGHSIGWDKDFNGEVAVVRIHNRALTPDEVKANYALLQNNKPLPESKTLIFNEDRRDLAAAAVEAAAAVSGELEIAGLKKAVVPDNAWVFPGKKAVRIDNVPDWGKEGFALEVWCQVDALPSGYAVLMRGSFGYPNFYGEKNIDRCQPE